ncbi:MAG: sulfatase-like hydrolase/transferase [Planctomycetota bacterium]|nr:sulfatase-like hydrolase/transferase [Planctomycetota bacterium]
MRFPRLERLLRTRFGGLYVFGGVLFLLSLALRIVLTIHEAPNADLRLGALTKVFAIGAIFDLATYFYLALPVAVFLLIVPDRFFKWRPHRVAAYVVYFIAIYVMLFDAAAEWCFWGEFSARFNFLAVDYLIYTRELIGNIRESYPLPALLGGFAAGAAAIFLLTFRLFRQTFESTSTFRTRLRPALIHIVAPLLAATCLSLSLASISRNYFTNELAKNGLYGFAAAMKDNTIHYDQFYLTEDDATAFNRVREWLKTDNARFTDEPTPGITRIITEPGPEKRWNVVILLVESLSGEFLTAFGNTDHITPNLDVLAKESLFFTHFYATGTRTDRGIEAITLSLPPTPGRSLVKRPDNDRLFSIGPIFRSRGYETKFIYAGYSVFDNMDTFFAGNGFEVIDRLAFNKKTEISFATIWGVCDEDLYRRTLVECDKSFDAGKPFCSFVLTTSNHRPFMYPQKIDIPSGAGRQGAVKYTDYAIGEFLRQARSRPWFDNTVFVIVADHCASSAGKTSVPVAKYHIPLIIYAPKLIPPRAVDKLTSQIDVAPTLLGLMGFTYTSKFFGMDALRPGPERALMGTYEKVGLYARGRLTLLLLRRESEIYRVAPDGQQTLAPKETDLIPDAVGYYQSASYLLQHNLYGAP